MLGEGKGGALGPGPSVPTEVMGHSRVVQSLVPNLLEKLTVSLGESLLLSPPSPPPPPHGRFFSQFINSGSVILTLIPEQTKSSLLTASPH